MGMWGYTPAVVIAWSLSLPLLVWDSLHRHDILNGIIVNIMVLGL